MTVEMWFVTIAEVSITVFKGIVRFSGYWAIANMVAFIVYMVFTVYRAAYLLTRYARERIAEWDSSYSRYKSVDPTFDEEYQEYVEMVEEWNPFDPVVALKLMVNAPILFYKLKTGEYDIYGVVEFGGVFSRDLRGFLDLLYYGRYVKYVVINSDIDRYLAKDKKRKGERLYWNLVTKTIYFWFYLPIKFMNDVYVVKILNTPGMIHYLYYIRKNCNTYKEQFMTRIKQKHRA